MDQALVAAIIVAVVVGSIGFVGNGLYSSRHGIDQPWLRRMRNLGLILVWPLVIVKALL